MTAAARPRVTVLYNAPILPPGHPDAIAEADVFEVAREHRRGAGPPRLHDLAPGRRHRRSTRCWNGSAPPSPMSSST